MILDVQTVTIHHPQKTNGHLHPSAPPITVMTSAEGRQAKKEWWPTAVDLLDICVCVCTCGVRQVFNLLLYSAVTQWFHNLRDSSPQNLKMSAFSSVWWNWAVQVGVFKTSKKNSTVSLSGNHNLVPRDNPQALNYFLAVSLHRRKRASTHQASCQAANPTVKVKWLLFDQCRPITFGKSGRS